MFATSQSPSEAATFYASYVSMKYACGI